MFPVKEKIYTVYIGNMSKRFLALVKFVDERDLENGFCTVIPFIGGYPDVRQRAEYGSIKTLLEQWDIVDRRILIEKTGCYI